MGVLNPSIIWGRYSLLTAPETRFRIHGNDQLGLIWFGYGTSVEDDADVDVDVLAFERLQLGQKHFYEFLDFVVGRWAALIVSDGRVTAVNDALAMQPVYYSLDSLLLASHLPFVSAELDERHGTSTNFKTLGQHKLFDETEDERVGALPPNFAFSFCEHELQRFYPRESEMQIEAPSEEAMFAEVLALAERSVSFWKKQPFELYCALTAGMDTRVNAAAALATTKDFSFVTYGSTSPALPGDQATLKSYKSDVLVSCKIAKTLDVPHVVFPIEEAGDYQLSAAEKAVLDQNFVGKHARNFLGMYEARLGTQPSICFVGNGLEVFKDYYVSTEQPLSGFDSFKKIVVGLAGYSEARRGHKITNAEAELLWSTYQYDAVAKSCYSVGNSLYWELRAGRFQSEAINCQSTAFMPVNPMAIRRVFELSQLLPFYRRKKDEFAQGIIQKGFPALAGFDVNGKKFSSRADRPELKAKLFERSAEGASPKLRVQTVPDILRLSSERILEGAESFLSYTVQSESCSLHIEFANRFNRGCSFSNVVLFIRVNGVETGHLGIGQRNYPQTVVVDSLGAGDRVDFGVRSTRENGIAWAGASQTRVYSMTEYADIHVEGEPAIFSAQWKTIDDVSWGERYSLYLVFSNLRAIKDGLYWTLGRAKILSRKLRRCLN